MVLTKRINSVGSNLKALWPGTPHAKPPNFIHHPSHNTQIINDHDGNDTISIKLTLKYCAYEISRETVMILLRYLIF